MNILKKVRQFFHQAKFFLGSSWITGVEVPEPSTRDYLQSFRASSLVHSCTKKIGEKMSTIEYELYQLRGLKAREIEQHELLDLLQNPNPVMSGSQLIEITSIYLSLLGQCYWYKARGANKQVIELWLMRPDLTTIVPANDGGISYYKFRLNGKEIKFPAEDVIHFKEPDPLSDYYGYGAVQSVMEVIRSDVYAKKWNTRFFYNSARPDALLTSEKAMNKEDKEEILEKWNEKYGGVDNAGKVSILTNGLKYEAVSVSQKDMDFANMRIANRDDVLMTLGVNKAIMAITDDVNRANAEAGVYAFLSETIRPKMEKHVDVLNQFLVTEYGDDLFLLNIDPTPDDKASLDDHYIKAHNKWMTTNEIRMEQGYDPIEGGDFIYQPLSLMPMGIENTNDTGEDDDDTNKAMKITKSGFAIIKIGGNITAKEFYTRRKEEQLKKIYRKAVRGRKMLRLKEDLISKITIEVAKSIQNQISKNAVKKEEEDKRKKAWDIFDKSIIGWEKKFKAMVNSLFREQQERALEALKKSKLGKTVKSSELDLLNFKKEVKIFIKKSTPTFTKIVEEAGNEALAQVGEKSIKKDFEISDPITAEWIELKAMKFAEEVNETTIKKIKNTLADGVLNGESIGELAKRIEEVYGLRILSSSKTISRTEVLSANNAGTVFGYKQSGVVKKKEWLATQDKKTRDGHSHADGQVVNIDKKFEVGDEELDYPGDPNGSPENIINCRCTILPVIE